MLRCARRAAVSPLEIYHNAHLRQRLGAGYCHAIRVDHERLPQARLYLNSYIGDPITEAKREISSAFEQGAEGCFRCGGRHMHRYGVVFNTWQPPGKALNSFGCRLGSGAKPVAVGAVRVEREALDQGTADMHDWREKPPRRTLGPAAML